MTYRIDYSHGISTWHQTYDDAVAAIRSVYTDPEIGHDGDITDGGERTLVWRDLESSDDDDGARAVATIRRLHDHDE